MKSLILTWQSFQDQEVVYPYYRLCEEAASHDDVVLMANVSGRIYGILGVNMDATAVTDELRDPACVEKYLQDFDLLVIPGGVKALEKLRQEKHVIQFIAEWNRLGKTIASTCHGAQLLISAKVVSGRRISGYYSIEDDIANAGATYVNASVVIDSNIVSSPHYQWMGEWMKAAIDVVRKA
jgi:protease I